MLLIAPDHALILWHPANLDGWNFRERQGRLAEAKVFQSETEFGWAQYRTQLFNPNEL